MKETIKKSFSKAASTYDAHASVQKEVISLLSMELDNIHFRHAFPQNILEIGCGTGNYTGMLLKRFKDTRIISLDISEGMVHEARKKFIHNKSVRFFVDDAESLTPSIGGPFDLVTSSGALHWFDDIKTGLRGIKPLISRHGIILVSIFGRETLKELQTVLKEVSGSNARISSGFFPNQTILSSIFSDFFPEWKINEHRITRTYPDLITFLRILKMTGTSPVIKEKPVIRHPEVLKKMEKFFWDSYGRIQATYQVFICKGKK